MADWVNVCIAAAALAFAVAAVAISLFALHETRRQADAAERDTHNNEAPDFTGAIVEGPNGRPRLELTLRTGRPVTRLHVEIITGDGQFRAGTPGVPMASSINARNAELEPQAAHVHPGRPVGWELEGDRPAEMRLSVTAYPVVGDEASAIQREPWTRLVDVEIPRTPMVARV